MTPVVLLCDRTRWKRLRSEFTATKTTYSFSSSRRLSSPTPPGRESKHFSKPTICDRRTSILFSAAADAWKFVRQRSVLSRKALTNFAISTKGRNGPQDRLERSKLLCRPLCIPNRCALVRFPCNRHMVKASRRDTISKHTTGCLCWLNPLRILCSWRSGHIRISA